MFHLDVFLLPQNLVTENGQMVCSYMEMAKQNATTGILSISMTRDLAHYIALQLDPINTTPSPTLIQDVVNEINNIIANHLRAYICTNIGIDLKMSLPKAGLPAKQITSPQIVNLHFRIREDDTLNLTFSYNTPPQQRGA